MEMSGFLIVIISLKKREIQYKHIKDFLGNIIQNDIDIYR